VLAWRPSLPCAALVLCTILFARSAHATGKQGDFIQTDTIGTSIVSRNLDDGTTTSLRNVVNISEFIGLHYYVVDRVRLGMNLQFTERTWPDPPPNRSRFQRFGFLPQIGWNFFDPLFTSLVFGIIPRTDGRAHLNLTVQGVWGVSFPLSDRVRMSVAGEVPYTYYDKHQVGLTALTGVSIRL